MNVQKLFAVLSVLAAPLAASASPATAGQVEAGFRSGAVTARDAAPSAHAEFTARFRDAVIHGASYNEAARTAQARSTAEVTSDRQALELLHEREDRSYALASTAAAPYDG